MAKIEVYIDSDNRSICFEKGTEAKEIGMSLLSFIESDLKKMDSEHPYLKYFKTNKKTLAQLQVHYKEAVIECLWIGSRYKDKIKQLSCKEQKSARGRAQISLTPDEILPATQFFLSETDLPYEPLYLHYEVIENNNQKATLFEVYAISDVASLCYIEFMKLVQLRSNVRICLNCKRFYIPKGEYDTKYCNRIPEGESRSCQQIGAVKTFKSKISSSPLLTEYSKIHHRFYSRKRNGKITPEQFDLWKKQAVVIRDNAVRENKTPEQLIEEINGISI